jgi:hypothetical protein
LVISALINADAREVLHGRVHPDVHRVHLDKGADATEH